MKNESIGVGGTKVATVVTVMLVKPLLTSFGLIVLRQWFLDSGSSTATAVELSNSYSASAATRKGPYIHAA
jgi:hypothetical protein